MLASSSLLLLRWRGGAMTAARRGPAGPLPRRRLLCAASRPPPKPPPTHDADGKPLPSIPDATTLFKISNPELLLDPQKRSSWKLVAGVVAFFSCYLTYTAYKEGLLTDGPEQLQQQAVEMRREAEVQKVLPDGRLLMRDGSIVRPPK